MAMSLYDTLNVTHHATPDVIQSAYRALARTYHPDVNPTAEAAARMQEINAAYAVLMDPDLRAQYDARRARQQRIKRTGWGGAGRAAGARPASTSTPASTPTPEPPTPAAGALGSSEPTMLIPKQCPRLGFSDDPSNRFRKPTQLHACFATGRSEGVSIYEQRLYCLESAFVHCPRWIAGISVGGSGPGASAPIRGGHSSAEQPFLRVVPRAARPPAGTPTGTPAGSSSLAARDSRWPTRGSRIRTWLLAGLILSGLILALIALVTLTFVLVADALDGRTTIARPAPALTVGRPESSSASPRSSHPAAESSTILPWACAFWRAGPGTSC